jgi:hypothetical protein
MARGMTGGLIAVAIVAAVAMWLRSRSSGDGAVTGVTPVRPPEPAPGPDAGEADDPEAGEAEADDGLVIAVTSAGEALVPDRHAIRLVPPEEQGESWKVGAGIKSASLRGEQALAMSWHSADFTGVRVVRGGAGEGAWILEALGRDGEYTTFDFETREGADAAQKLFESHGIVQIGEDEDGRPMPPSAEQFAEARRMYHESEAALELPDDEDPR